MLLKGTFFNEIAWLFRNSHFSPIAEITNLNGKQRGTLPSVWDFTNIWIKASLRVWMTGDELCGRNLWKVVLHDWISTQKRIFHSENSWIFSVLMACLRYGVHLCCFATHTPHSWWWMKNIFKCTVQDVRIYFCGGCERCRSGLAGWNNLWICQINLHVT